MRRVSFAIAFVVLVFLSSICLGQESKQAASTKPTMKLVMPSEVKYGPLPADLVTGKPSVETSGTLEAAVLSGDPAKPGPFALLLHCTDGYKVAPHWHPGTENVLVLQGSLGIGMGSNWDEPALKVLPTHSFASIPARMRHFAQCNGDTVVEVHGYGPFKLNFVSAPVATPAKKTPEGSQ